MKVIIFYSGGKDSQAALIWAVNKYGVNKCEAVFSDTVWENPITYSHIINTCKQLGVKYTKIISSKYKGMVDLSKKKKRFPSSQARFCTEELKIKPSIDYILKQKEHLLTIEGIRADESAKRAKMDNYCTYFKYYFQAYNDKGRKFNYRKKEVIEWSKKYNADKYRPMFTWTAEQCLDYIKDNGQVPNPLYYMGFSRVGCFPCMMARHREVELIIENHPDQWQKVKEAEKEVGHTFFPPDYIPMWATKNGKWVTCEDIEKYIKGKNSTLDLFELETPACMSVYNLCE